MTSITCYDNRVKPEAGAKEDLIKKQLFVVMIVKSNINILIVESHYRTRTWLQAMKNLGNIFSISVLPEEKNYFINNGVNKKNILNLHLLNIAELDAKICADYIKKNEDIYQFKLSEIVQMDRTLRNKDYDYILRYTYCILKKITDFIKSNGINIIFIEPTWTHEIIICKISQHLKIPTWSPVSDKLIDNRFYMFRGYVRDEYYLRKSSEFESIKKDIDQVMLLKNKPQYFHRQTQRNKLNIRKFKMLYMVTRLALLGYKNNNIQPPWSELISKKISAITRSYYLKKLNIFSEIVKLPLPYVLITLQVQPEAGIDVIGNKFSNQIEFVRQMSLTCPADHCIAVKEHPHDFGRRGMSFYKELKAIPNVYIISPDYESRKAIINARLVVSIAGSSSLEAAIMGVPSVTAVKMYYSKLILSYNYNPFVDCLTNLLTAGELWRKQFNQIKIKEELHKIQLNSFEGNTRDFLMDKYVLTKENINNLKNAFSEVINSECAQ